MTHLPLRGQLKMSEHIVDAIDAVLTVLFWLPAKFLHYEKCQKCTIRVRWFQFLLILTYPLKWYDPLKSQRIDWKLRTEAMDPQSELRPL